MENKVFLGDCLEIMKDIPDKCIDVICADLPYGTTRCKWDTIIPLDELWKIYKRIRKDNCAIILFANEPFTSALISSNYEDFKYRITWDKMTTTGHLNSSKMPLQRTEDICVFYKQHPTYNPQFTQKSKEHIKATVGKFTGKEQNNNIYGYAKSRELSKNYDKMYPTTLIQFSAKAKECNSVNRVHPTQKPVELLEYLIKTYTTEGDLILDNVAGSGTTAIAALNTNRKYILIEKEKEYYDVILRRIAEWKPKE